MARPRMKTAELNVRMTPELKQAVQRIARADQTTVSELITRLAVQLCQQRGVVIGKPRKHNG
jgi:uncharacterized protein (DUF1778 family)